MTTAIGRGFTRGGPAVNPGSFNRDRSLYHKGRGQIGRMGFRNDLNINNTYPDFHQRQFGMKNYFLLLLVVIFVAAILVFACLGPFGNGKENGIESDLIVRCLVFLNKKKYTHWNIDSIT